MDRQIDKIKDRQSLWDIKTKCVRDLQNTFGIRQELAYCRTVGEIWRQRNSHFWSKQKTVTVKESQVEVWKKKERNADISRLVDASLNDQANSFICLYLRLRLGAWLHSMVMPYHTPKKPNLFKGIIMFWHDASKFIEIIIYLIQ